MGRRMKVYGTNSIDGFFFTLIAQDTHTICSAELPWLASKKLSLRL
jgi:hypothetical protein